MWNKVSMIILSYLLAFALSAAASAATYKCTTEFGETIPLRLTVLKAGANCARCEEPSSEIPSAAIDDTRSLHWNRLLSQAAGATKVKRHEFLVEERKAYVDTRYFTRAGPAFSLELNCEEKKCGADFGGAKSTLHFTTPLRDERTAGGGEVEIKIGKREHLGLIVRVKKNAVNLAAGGTIPVSASGELKIYRPDPLFIQDVGADEQLAIGSDTFMRIAAIEVKIRCE
ncbi:MAG: hypothetical protein EOP11_21125, partial [Proteobacteria bacterium]